MAKQLTHEQAERKKTHAAEFLVRIGQPERAEQFDEMTVEEYAEHKGFQLANPRQRPKRRGKVMANGTSKADLQDQIDQAIDILDDAYAPEPGNRSKANVSVVGF